MPREPQPNDPFEEPPFDQIAGISRMHVQAMETMDDDMVWIGAGMHQVIIYTIGRKSGNEHKVALPYWVDRDGNRVVVASFSGAPDHPSWYLNLTDRDGNPEVKIRVQQGLFWADAQILEDSDYAETWAGLTADRPWYDDYQSRTDRQIPLVRLVELRPA